MIKLPERGHDQLKRKLALWREEVEVYPDETTLTLADCTRLEKRIERLVKDVEALDYEYWIILGM